MSVSTSVPAIHAALREQRPLVQCITNYVSMDLAANLLNAAGASPAMVHDPHESAEFAGLASAVVANIGTPSPPWVDGMIAAVEVAHERGIPWVLDPVAVGATSYRREIVDRLLAHAPTVIRANASEVLAIAGSVGSEVGKGVDSAADATSDPVRAAASALAARLRCVVAMTGTIDFVTDGDRSVTVTGGDPLMPLITALGCSASALVAACCAAGGDTGASTTVDAAATALAMLSAAGESAGRQAAGPGSMRWRLLDELSTLEGDRLQGYVR